MATIDFDNDDTSTPPQAAEWASAKRVLAEQCPPPQVEAALLRAFERRHAPLPWYRRRLAPALVCASCVAALVVGFFRAPPMAPAAPTPMMVAMDQGFVPLVDLAHLNAATHAQLLHAELPSRVLASLGLAVNGSFPDELVRADLMVTEAGEPIAIRLAFH